MAKRKNEADGGTSPSEPAADTRDAKPRLSMPLTDQGKIDWASMRPSTRDQWLDLLRNDPQLGAGTGAARSSGDGDIFSAPMAGMLFDMLGNAEVAITMNVYHCSREDAAIMLYSEQEKAYLTGPLLKVLNKYGASWLSKWGDEIMLAGLMVSVHLPKITKLQETIDTPKPRRVPPDVNVVWPRTAESAAEVNDKITENP